MPVDLEHIKYLVNFLKHRRFVVRFLRFKLSDFAIKLLNFIFVYRDLSLGFRFNALVQLLQ